MDCHFLSRGIHIEKYDIRDCCVRRNGEKIGIPFVMKIEDVENFDYDKLFKLKRELKQEKLENPTQCKGCVYSNDFENFSNEEIMISYISFNHWNTCNSNCIYCDKKYNGGDFYYNILPFVKGLIKTDKVKHSGEILFLGGEPTLLPEIDDLLTIFFERNFKIKIFSSGIKYSDLIAKGLRENLVTLVISPDTGKKETYERIKRVKQFDRVWENIRKYSLSKNEENVNVKMIIIPGINDTTEEVDMFLKKAKESNINRIVIDVEAGYGGKYEHNLPNVRYLIEYIKYKCEKENIAWDVYSIAVMVERNTEKPDLPKAEYEIKNRYEEIRTKYAYRNIDYNYT